MDKTETHVLLLGSPGSGKTQTIIEEVERVVRGGGRAVILAPSRALMGEIRNHLVRRELEVMLTNMDYPIRTEDLVRSKILITSPWKLLSLLATRGTRREEVAEWMRSVRLIALDEVHSYLGESGKAGIGRIILPIVLGFWHRISGADQPPRVFMASATLADEMKEALTQLLGSSGGVSVREIGASNVRTIIALVPDPEGAWVNARGQIEFKYKEAMRIDENGGAPPIAFPAGYTLRGRGSLDPDGVIDVIPNQYWFAKYILDLYASAYEALRSRNAIKHGFQAIVQVPWRKMADGIAREIALQLEKTELANMGVEILVHHGGIDANKRKLVEETISNPGNRIVVTCLTLSVGVNIPGAHLLMIHPRSVSVALEQEEDEEPSDPSASVESRHALTQEGLIQLMGRVGRPGISEPGWVIIPFPSLSDFEFYREALSGRVEFRSMEWSEYSLRVAVGAMMAMIPEMGHEEALTTFIQHTVDYFLADPIVGREKLFNKLSSVWGEVIEQGSQLGLFQGEGWTRFGRILLSSALPLQEALIPLRLALEGCLDYDSLLEEIFVVQKELGSLDRFDYEDLEEIKRIGMLVYQIEPKIADLAETIYRSLGLLSSTLKRLAWAKEEAPSWLQRISIRAVSETVDEITNRFASGGDPKIVRALEILGKGNRHLIRRMIQNETIEGQLPPEDLFGDIVINPAMTFRPSDIVRRLEFLSVRIAGVVKERGYGEYLMGWMESIYRYLCNVVLILADKAETPPDVFISFLPIERRIVFPSGPKWEEAMGRYIQSFFDKYPYAIVQDYQRDKDGVGATAASENYRWPAIMLEVLEATYQKNRGISFRRSLKRYDAPRVHGRHVRNGLLPGDVVGFVCGDQSVTAVVLPEVFDRGNRVFNSFSEMIETAYLACNNKKMLWKPGDEK